MIEWQKILRKTLAYEVDRPDRTGVGTRALFGEQLVFDNNRTFPAVTTKKLMFEQVAAELACFIRGYDNLEDFHNMGCHIWDANSKAFSTDGQLGRIYGVQWRDWRDDRICNRDQLLELVEGLKTDPYSRRHLVTAWNPGELDEMCLPPCHVLFQCFVVDNRLDLRVDMRSVDLFLGLPFDVASYAILQRLIAKECGLSAGWLIFQLGDAHIYKNHFEQVEQVLRTQTYEAPFMHMDPSCSLFDFHPAQVYLTSYLHHGYIPAPLNV